MVAGVGLAHFIPPLSAAREQHPFLHFPTEQIKKPVLSTIDLCSPKVIINALGDEVIVGFVIAWALHGSSTREQSLFFPPELISKTDIVVSNAL
jgi:hypothetical protein